MPLKIEPADRKLLYFVSVGLLLVCFALLLLTPPQEEDIHFPSSYSTRSGGAKAAYLLLADLGYQVERWEQPPSFLPPGDPDTVLILAEPFSWFATQPDRDALQKFVASGGRVLAISSSAARLLPGDRVTAVNQPQYNRRAFKPQAPTPLTRAGEIIMVAGSSWDPAGTDHIVHYALDDTIAVVSYRVGKGEVVYWAGDLPITNAGITLSGNLSLFLNSIGGGPGTRVLWDEHFHGDRPSPWSRVRDLPVRWGLAQAGFLLLAAIVTYSRRSGPLRPLVRRSRLSPLEFVATLGALYGRSRAASYAVDMAYQRFRALTIRRLGLPGEIGARDLAQAITRRFAVNDPRLSELLVRCESAGRDPDLTESAALALVRDLNQRLHALKLLPNLEEKA